MRMFLTGMTDLFLILYLTAVASNPAPSVWTVEDFYKMKSMHETLQSEKQKEERDFQEKLINARKEREDLAAKLAAEQARANESESSLQASTAKLLQINQDLQKKNDVLKEKEQLLVKLDQTIKDKEASWGKKESLYKAAAESNQILAQTLEAKAQEFRRLVDQMRKGAEQADQRAAEAKAARQQALLLKDAALKEKKEADDKAREAQEARAKAEAAKAAAVKAAEAAQKVKELAEERANKLSVAIRGIKQDSDLAYLKNVRPLLQQLNVRYEEQINDVASVYNKELHLLPVMIKGQAYVFFPYQHIGFSRRYDTPPRRLEIQFKGQKIERALFNKADGLIAVALPGFAGKSSEPLPVVTGIGQYMPVLLALRDNADVSIVELFRGLSEDYCVINRDNIQPGENGNLVHFLKGWRGTGKRAERVLQGDQLVDLDARFIGVAKDADHIVRIDTLMGWEERVLK